jgi:hypothetical protein
MEGNKQTSLLNAPERKQQPISLVAHLMQDMADMQQVDDIFFWLSKEMTQHLDISVTQFWAAELDKEHQMRIQARAFSNLDSTLAQQIHINRQVASVVKRVLSECRGVTSRPVEQVFPAPQATLLAQHNLRYWAAYLLRSDDLLPLRNTAPRELEPTPLTMVVSFFTHYPLTKKQKRAINFILEQALRMIGNRKLLIPPSELLDEKTTEKQAAIQALAKIVPQKLQDLADFQADNPFAQASIINDKNARHLYAAINGQKNITELAQDLNFTEQESYQALHYLYQEEKIEFITPAGKPVEGSHILALLQ